MKSLQKVEKIHQFVSFYGKNAQKTKKICKFFCSFKFFVYICIKFFDTTLD